MMSIGAKMLSYSVFIKGVSLSSKKIDLKKHLKTQNIITINFTMTSQVEYYRLRLAQHDDAVDKICLDHLPNISSNKNKNEKNKNKKRKYEEAMGYSNDYNIVQDSETDVTNKIKNNGNNWTDAYLENLSNK